MFKIFWAHFNFKVAWLLNHETLKLVLPWLMNGIAYETNFTHCEVTFLMMKKKVKIALKRSLFLFDFALKMHTKMPCLSVQNFTLHLRSLRVHPRMLLVLFSEPGIKLFEHQTCLNCARIYWGRCLCRGSCRFRCGFLSHFGQLSVIANEGWNDHRHHCHQREQNKESWKTGSWQADSIDDVLLDFTLKKNQENWSKLGKVAW